MDPVRAHAEAMTFSERWNVLARNRLIRAVGVLVGGTAFAHAITLVTLPIVTRLYTPSDFSALAVFASLLSILSVAACLRFDVAIPIPENDAEALNLLALSLSCTVIVATLVALPALGAPQRLASWLNQPILAQHLWLLPFGVAFAGTYSTLQMWNVRRKAFAVIARNRIGQSAAASGTQLGLGLLHCGPIGLIIGSLLNTGVGCIGLGWRFMRAQRGALNTVNAAGLLKTFKAYDRFPKYSTFEALANSASIQLPIVLIAAVALGPEAGFLALAISAMQAPIGLIGTAVSQVYLSRAPEEYRSGTLDAFTTRIFGALIKSGVGPLLFAGFVAPDLFGVVFGEPWRRAGALVAWMTPWFIMQLLSSTVSMALHVTGHQRTALLLQIVGLILRVGAVLGASMVEPKLLSEAYAISGFIFYLAYLIAVLRTVGTQLRAAIQQVLSALPYLLTWTAAGWVVSTWAAQG